MTSDDQQALILAAENPDGVLALMREDAARSNARAAAKGWLGWQAEREAQPELEGDLERDMRRVLQRMSDGRERTVGDLARDLKMHAGRATFICGHLRRHGYLGGEKIKGPDVWAYWITRDGLAWVRGVEP